MPGTRVLNDLKSISAALFMHVFTRVCVHACVCVCVRERERERERQRERDQIATVYSDISLVSSCYFKIHFIVCVCVCVRERERERDRHRERERSNRNCL